MSSNPIYVVYHITYSGNKLPSNYIGSTSLENLNVGYMGSVLSKNYKDIWKQELKEHPELFHLEIISYHDTRPEATYKELQIQKIFNVVKNPLFVNMSYASPNGFFGMSTKGIPKSDSHRSKMNGNTNASACKGKPKSIEHRNKISLSNTGKRRSDESNKKQAASMKGRVLTEDHKNKISKALTGKLRGNVSKTMSLPLKKQSKFFSIIETKKTYTKQNLSRYFPDFKIYY